MQPKRASPSAEREVSQTSRAGQQGMSNGSPFSVIDAYSVEQQDLTGIGGSA